jgi:hypothetical protein
MTAIEQRAHARYSVEHPVEVGRGEARTEGRTINLSRGGLLASIPISPPLKMGERVGVTLRVPDLEAAIVCQAEVRWANRVDETIVGLQFVTGLRAKEAWALGRFLERIRDGLV